MRLLYTFIVRVYYLLILFTSPFNKKAKGWLSGRKDLFKKVRQQLSAKPKKPGKVIWFHCASLGEFEQGRPVIEKLRLKDPDVNVILTFFSPSGYEARHDYNGADHVFYLPLDTPANAKEFIGLIQPQLVFFVKYEFWYNHLAELKQRGIPLYLISGIFRKDQIFFSWYGGWFRKQLKNYTHFFVQDETSAILLQKAGLNNVTVSGDTRFDRVYEIAQQAKEFPLAAAFKANSKLFVAGSSWPEDEQLLSDGQWLLGDKKWKLLIAPHELDEKHLLAIEQRFRPFSPVRYSKAAGQDLTTSSVLIIDNIGMLSSLYRYGDVAFIGGGFGEGIHNLSEAAVFGVPVIFGPNYHKFKEAFDLIEGGGGFTVKNEKELRDVFHLLNDPLVLKMAGMACRNYVNAKKGATQAILSRI